MITKIIITTRDRYTEFYIISDGHVLLQLTQYPATVVYHPALNIYDKLITKEYKWTHAQYISHQHTVLNKLMKLAT